MQINTKFKISDKIVYFNNGEHRCSKVVNITTSTFCNQSGEIQTNEIYTLENGYLFVVANGEARWS